MVSLAPLYRSSIVIFVVDQLTKLYVVQYLNLKEIGTLTVFEPYLVFRMAWNTGINFGIGGGQGDLAKWFLIALALVISGWIFWWMRKEQPSRVVQISAGFVIGGALGNVIDRVIYGAVAAFLNMSCCGFDNPWSFNVADIAIFVGAAGLILFSGNSSKDSDAAGKAG
ncbi:MAG: signal peptidase II [Boseongicola sp.]|nr:signal peptidase II [Boseongicola sp.]